MTGHDLQVSYPLPSAVDLQQLGALVASSSYFADAKEAAQAAVKIMAGAELGMGPIASMRGIDIIKGEVSLSAGMVAALVRRSGVYDYSVEQWDNEGCRIRFYRNGRAMEPASVFTVQDAASAGLTHGQNWQRFTRNMLFARAMTNGARIHCPDVFVGAVYADGELIDAETVPEPESPSNDPVASVEQLSVPEAAEEAAAAPPAPPRLDPVTAPQEAYLQDLILRCREDGMTTAMLRAILDRQGLEDTVIGEGWLRTLTRGQASGLIGVLSAGVKPAHDPAGGGMGEG